MMNRLYIKLLTPIMSIGGLILVASLFLSDPLTKFQLIALLFFMILLQLVVSAFIIKKSLIERIASLTAYLSVVIDVNKAPAAPLKDDTQDDLALFTNQFSDFVVNLSQVMSDLRDESQALKNEGEVLNTHIKSSTHSVDLSSHEIQQMAKSLNEVANTSTILSQNALQVSETTQEVLSVLEQGVQSSQTSQKTIESVNQEVQDTANDLKLLQDECNNIGTVLDVIRGIAEQTNLLALNAAIEAARAGEQGRGFAVVADEVRALAHRTQESTLEIQSMVEGLQEKSDNSVNAIERGQSLTQESLSHSQEVVEALSKIGGAFEEVGGLTSEMANGTNEQQVLTLSLNDNMNKVVTLSDEVNQGLSSVVCVSEKQHRTSLKIDENLNKICV